MTDSIKESPFPEPFTHDEWIKFCKATLHGPPPQQTLLRIYATVDLLMCEREALKRQLNLYEGAQDAEKESS